MAASPFVAWLVVRSQLREALIIVLLAGLTDWLDGFTARKLGVIGKAGVLLDPLADKTLLVTLFLVLGFVRLIPFWMLCLAVGRDLVIVFGSLLLRLLREIRRFKPSMLGKVSTFFQIVLVLLVLLDAAYPYGPLFWLKQIALACSAFLTAASGLDYVRRGIEMSRRSPVQQAPAP